MNTTPFSPTEVATPSAPSGGGLRGAIASEWTKLWTVRSTRWLVFGSVLLMATITPMIGVTLKNNNITDGSNEHYLAGDLAGDATYYVVQLMIAALAMLTMTAEYGSGSIRSTLQWVPNRGRLLLAKCLVISAVSLATGLAIGAVGTVLASLSLGEYGHAPLERTVDQAAAIAVYLGLTSVITVYVAAIIRSAPASLTAALLVNMAIPSLMQASGILPLMWTAQYTPSIAGRNFVMIDTGPYQPLVGLAILIAWAVVGFFVTRHVFTRRDAG